MTRLKSFSVALVGIMLAEAASAQVFVLGPGLGGECYEYTRNNFRTFATADRTCTRALREEVLTRDNRAATYVNRGIIRMRHGEYDQAIEDYHEAITLKPGLGEAYLNEGAALSYKDLFAEAIPQLDRAIELQSADVHAAYYNRAIAKENSGDIAGAYYDFMKALELKPGWEMAETQLTRFRVEPNAG